MVALRPSTRRLGSRVNLPRETIHIVEAEWAKVERAEVELAEVERAQV
jgi:hypothetical protein